MAMKYNVNVKMQLMLVGVLHFLHPPWEFNGLQFWPKEVGHFAFTISRMYMYEIFTPSPSPYAMLDDVYRKRFH